MRTVASRPVMAQRAARALVAGVMPVAGVALVMLCAFLLADVPEACAQASHAAPRFGDSEGLETIEAPPLRIHHPEGYGAMAMELARRGPAEVDRVASALGLPQPRHLDVYLLPSRAAVDPREWGLPLGPRWAAGLALHGRPVVVLRTSEDVGPYGNEVARVLTHELVHAIASQGLGPRYSEIPAWMREGTASYLSFDWRLVDSARSARHALAGDLIPLENLESFPEDAETAQRAYLQSFAFVAWLVDRSGPDALARFHADVARGERFESAFRDAFGDLPSRLVEDFRGRYLLVYRWVPLLTSTSSIWLLTVGIFLLAGLRRRLRSKRTLERWEDEDEAVDATLAAAPEEGMAAGERTSQPPRGEDRVH